MDDKRLNEPIQLTWVVDFMVIFLYCKILWSKWPWQIYIGDQSALLMLHALNIEAVGLMVLEKILRFPIINDPLGVASLDPMGLIGRIYLGDH